ncbi:MAG: porphobilinogen synthase [Synergistaceae bacterium]
MIIRPRRLRQNENIRNMVAETKLAPSMFTYPIFIKEGKNLIEDIEAMPGQKRYSPDNFPLILEKVQKAGITSVLLFGIPKTKDETGSGAYDDNGVVQQALRIGKKNFPDITYMADVCLCEYTSHGHCGVLKGNTIENDTTLKLLEKSALSYANAGADVIAPSDMMDGRIAAIRTALDAENMQDKLIFSYAVKYASAFYGPFREAAGSAPSFGDRKSYQMDPRNIAEAIREAKLDIDEGADMIMVKPGLPYLDVLKSVKEISPVPVGSYCVSGEYSMIKAAAQNGWIDEERTVSESMVCLARAGADIIITYSALDIAKWLKEGKL